MHKTMETGHNKGQGHAFIPQNKVLVTLTTVPKYELSALTDKKKIKKNKQMFMDYDDNNNSKCITIPDICLWKADRLKMPTLLFCKRVVQPKRKLFVLETVWLFSCSKQIKNNTIKTVFYTKFVLQNTSVTCIWVDTFLYYVHTLVMKCYSDMSCRGLVEHLHTSI